MSRATSRQRTELVLAGIAPLALVLAARLVLPSAIPMSAMAEEDAREPLQAPAAWLLERDASRADPALLRVHTSEPAFPSPMALRDGTDEQVAEPAQVVVPDEPAAPDAPGVVLSAVLGGARPLAVIDGKALRVGSLVAPGWTLAEISALRHSVVLRHESGATHVLTIER